MCLVIIQQNPLRGLDHFRVTRLCYVYLIKIKDEMLDYFKIYKAEVETQLERKIKRLRSDCDGEYFSLNI